MKEHIAILYNILEDKVQGTQHYRDVEMIDEALRGRGHDVVKIPVGKDVGELISQLINISPRYIFNVCEEVDNNSWGEIYIAGLLELLRIPYTGSNPFCLALALNKARTKDVLQSQSVTVPKYQVFNSEDVKLMQYMTFPLILKPLCEDGSFGIDPSSVVFNENELYERILAKKNEFKGLLIAEEYIEGREFNVAILGNGDSLQLLPVSEIDYSTMPPTVPKICSYSAKWEKESIEYKNTIPVCPVKISNKLQKILEEAAVKAYKIMGCTDYARVDIRLSKEKELPYVIDVNPNPCISPNSGFVRSALAAGMEYKDLMNTILTLCQKRYGNGA